MGTRNITRVILDGEIKVNQYSQWDGYPTGRGNDVLLFMRDILSSPGQKDEFIRRLRLSSLNMLNDGDQRNTTYTGAPIDAKDYDALERFDEYRYKKMKLALDNGLETDYITTAKSAVQEGEFTLEEMVTVFAASRDVGCYVLPFLMEFCPDGMALWTDEYSLNVPPEGDWQIQGVFTIDFDAQTVAISFNGDTSWSISFDALASKTDKSIFREMVKLESRIRGEEE